MNLRSGNVQRLSAFARPQYQASGAYNGEVAVWKEYHSQDTLDSFSVKEWVRRTGKIYTIGRSRLDPKTGAPYPSPWSDPALGRKYAAWVQGTSQDGGGRLIVADTGTRSTRTFSSGHPGGALLLYDKKLIWAESTKPGALTTVFAKELSSGSSTPPPTALATQRGGVAFAGDGRAIAWIGSDQRSVYYSADGESKARLLLRLPVGGFNPPTVLRGGVVMSTFSEGVLAVTSNGVRTTLVNGGGAVVGAGDSFVVEQPPPTKSPTYAEGLALLHPTDLLSAKCAK